MKVLIAFYLRCIININTKKNYTLRKINCCEFRIKTGYFSFNVKRGFILSIFFKYLADQVSLPQLHKGLKIIITMDTTHKYC